MHYSEFEICKDYREAKNKGCQIKIMAELNGTSQEAIKDVLIRNGVMEPSKKARAGPKVCPSASDNVIEGVKHEADKVTQMIEVAAADIVNNVTKLDADRAMEIMKLKIALDSLRIWIKL